MTGFEFDRGPTPGTNRTAAPTACAMCGGDRFVPVDPEQPHGAYYRCNICNPAPSAVREPVAQDAWWKQQ